MRRPLRKFVFALVCLAIAAIVFRAALSEVFGPEDSGLTMAAGPASVLGLMIAGYFVVASALAARGVARLAKDGEVIARWTVPAATWDRYCDIKLADARVSLPGLSGLMFEPRRKTTTDSVEVVCGKWGVLIDECYFSVAPGRGAGMEQAGLVHTQPPCVALVIATRTGAPHVLRTVRRLLLLPIPGGAEREANKAIVHYAAAVEGVRDLGDIARASPGRAKAIFFGVLIACGLAAGIGIALEASDYPGDLPAMLALPGILIGLGLLILGWRFQLFRLR
jgi:hypothetical protein